MTFDIDILNARSPTAMVCENAQLFGTTPERDEFDPREVWDADDAMDAVSEAFRILAEGIAPDGFQLADEREHLLWGVVNAFDAQVRSLDRSVDRLTPEMRDLMHAQDGTEINARELELVTERAQNLGDRRDAFERMRDAVAEQYRTATGEVWRPRRGSHTSQTGKLTSAAIDARDFRRARKDRETRAHLPSGTLVAVTGGRHIADANAVFVRLDRVRAKYPDMVLVHGGGPGVEQLAAQWAEQNGVHQVVCKPDWQRHGRGTPFRRNDELLGLMPKGVVAFPGSGITDNSRREGHAARYPRTENRGLSPAHDGPCRRTPGRPVHSRRHHPVRRRGQRRIGNPAPPAALRRVIASALRSVLAFAAFASLALALRPSPVTSSPFSRSAVHRHPHCRPRSRRWPCRLPCGRCRRRVRQRAAHDCLRLRPHRSAAPARLTQR